MSEVPPKPLRILVVVTPRSQHWPSAWTSADDVVSAAAKCLEESQILRKHEDDLHIRLLAKHRWPCMVNIVFDTFNDSYDPKQAHLPEHNNLPVAVVRLGKKMSATHANTNLRDKVNKEIAIAHNLNGEDGLPPFLEDHTLNMVPEYANPRDFDLLTSMEDSTTVTTKECSA
jgi:hypothetical protein